MSDAAASGADFKKQLREGQPKLGLFLNSHSPTVAEQLAHSGYDWLLVDTQHGPMGYERLSAMLAGIAQRRREIAWSASAATTIAPAFSRLSTWAPTASSFPISTPPKKPARPSAAPNIRPPARAASISRSAA